MDDVYVHYMDGWMMYAIFSYNFFRQIFRIFLCMYVMFICMYVCSYAYAKKMYVHIYDDMFI